MGKILVTHPDNIELLRRECHKWLADQYSASELAWGWPPFLDVRADKCIERFAPSRKIKLPSGEIVDRSDFRMRCGPVTYGPEDLLWLMWSGAILEQLEPLFYIMDELLSFRVFDFHKPVLMTPRAIILNTGIF